MKNIVHLLCFLLCLFDLSSKYEATNIHPRLGFEKIYYIQDLGNGKTVFLTEGDGHYNIMRIDIDGTIDTIMTQSNIMAENYIATHVIDMYCQDTSRIYLLCSENRLYRTTDAGETYKLFDLNDIVTYQVRGIRMIDFDKGFIFDGQKIYLTEDGFETIERWNLLELWPKEIDDAEYYDNNSCISLFSDYYDSHNIFKSCDNGVSWHKDTIDPYFVYPEDLYIYNDSNWWLVCSSKTGIANYNYGYVFRSSNQGVSWELALYDTLDKQWGLTDIIFRNEKEGMAVGDYGKAYITLDGGDNWERVDYKHSNGGIGISPKDSPVLRVGLWQKKFIISAWDGGVWIVNEPINSIEETKSNEIGNLLISPNPADSKIRIDADVIGKIDELMIFDALGNELMLLRSFDPMQEIDLAGFASGMYFLRIYSAGGLAVSKFVKN